MNASLIRAENHLLWLIGSLPMEDCSEPLLKFRNREVSLIQLLDEVRKETPLGVEYATLFEEEVP